MLNDGRFKGLVQSEAIDGEAVITLTEEAVLFEKTGRSQTVPYSEIDAFSVVNYRLVIDAEGKRITVSQMGRDTDVLCQKLWDAYNARTLKAFFVEGAPSFEAEGEYRYRDDGGQSQGEAKLLLFPDCLCILPKSAEGRRVPLCFMEEPVLEGFTIKMTLDTGETYELIRLGDRTKRLCDLIRENLLTIHNNAIAAARAVDPALGAKQASDIARLIPEGAAASIAALGALAPSFVGAAEKRIGASRAAEPYAFFREICPPDRLYAGMKTGLGREEEEDEAGVVWVTAVKAGDGGGVAAVELAVGDADAAATYLYRFSGEPAAFFRRLNHAMEAVGFRREVVSVPDGELRKNDLYVMAVKRTGALRFLRGCFAGRAIHRSPEAWKKSVREWMGG